MEFDSGEYHIYSRDQNFQHIDEVKEFTELELHMRFNDIGAFTLHLPTKEYFKRWDLKASNWVGGKIKYLTVPGDTDITYAQGLGSAFNKGSNTLGIIVTKDDDTTANALFTGVITNVERDWEHRTSDYLVVSGQDDRYFLNTRVVWPDPTHQYDSAHNYWWTADGVTKDAFWRMTNYNEVIANQIVDYSIGPAAIDTWRRVAYLDTETAGTRGIWVTYNSRFESLFDAVTDVLELPQSSFGPPAWAPKITQVSETASTRLLYSLWVGSTSNAVFSEDTGTITKYVYSEKRPDYIKAYIGGICWTGSAQSQEKSERIYTHRQNDDMYLTYGYSEGFVDYTGQDTANDNLATFISDMGSYGGKTVLDVSKHVDITIDLTESNAIRFPDDFNIGSLVTVQLPVTDLTQRQEFQERVREVNLMLKSDGTEKISTTVADLNGLNYSYGLAYQLSRNQQYSLRNTQRLK